MLGHGSTTPADGLHLFLRLPSLLEHSLLARGERLDLLGPCCDKHAALHMRVSF